MNMDMGSQCEDRTKILEMREADVVFRSNKKRPEYPVRVFLIKNDQNYTKMWKFKAYSQASSFYDRLVYQYAFPDMVWVVIVDGDTVLCGHETTQNSWRKLNDEEMGRIRKAWRYKGSFMNFFSDPKKEESNKVGSGFSITNLVKGVKALFKERVLTQI